MATPSSSATSPSPPMAYLTHTAAQPPPNSSASSDSAERDQRKKAVQKFLARAEISMVTRALRARLSYASYKATHNIPHVSLCDLEARTTSQGPPITLPRTIAAKRKAAALHKDNANTGVTISPAATCSSRSSHRRGASGSMAPPPALSSTQTKFNSSQTSATIGQSESGSSSGRGPASSLYTSILAPPPTKQARTIHNADEPPISPSSRTAPSPRTRVAKPSSRAEGRGRGRGKNVEHTPKPANSPGRRRGKNASIDKGKQKQALVDAEMNVDADGDVDMKAAATLTSWLLHNRQPTMAGSASSPRSSFDGSDTNSTYSYSHFAQSSARTTTTVASAGSPAAVSTTSTAEPPARSRTPSPVTKMPEHVTPRTAPTDNEAADLMLLFATSPSPARPAGNKDNRDMAAFRALTGNSNALLSKGRVLFPSFGSGDAVNVEDAGGVLPRSPYRHQHTRSGPPLVRAGGDGSFNSSISSISSEMMGRRSSTDANSGSGLSRQLTPSLSQLLPPPPLPIHDAATAAGSGTARTPDTPAASSAVQSPKSSGGLTAEFNFSDFINASPSPARAGATTLLVGSVQAKPSLGLRADVGRKLFEEEQMRNAMGGGSGAGGGGVGRNATTRSPAQESPREQGLGASIDLNVMQR
ncbi:hypothetical protein AX17_006388 [Amanita inopinata Kibby_2008]|nr:hypothetical protein AX17_006388 [Amanita inopinata Kibby_2008]